MVNKLNTVPRKTVIAITLATLLTACGGGDEEVNNIPTPANPTNPNNNTDGNTPTDQNTITKNLKIEGVVDTKEVTTVNIKDKNWGIIMSTQTDQNGNFSFDYDAVKKMIADKKLVPYNVIEISAIKFNLAFKLPDSVTNNLQAQLNNTSNAVYSIVYGKGFDSNTVKEMDTLAKSNGINTDGNLISTAEDLNNLSKSKIIAKQTGSEVYLENLPEGKTIYFSYNDGISLYQLFPDKGIEVRKGDTIKYVSFTTDNKKEPLGSFRVDDSKIN